MTIVMPNLRHMWGFQGFKNQFDRIRREQDDELEDMARPDSQCPDLDRERQRRLRRIARAADKARLSKCVYCQQAGKDLVHCEHPGCSQLMHKQCHEEKYSSAIDILCPLHATRAGTKRQHGMTPPPEITGRPSNKITCPENLSSVRRTLFHEPDEESPAVSEDDERSCVCGDATEASVQSVPSTPAEPAPGTDDPTPARTGRGG